MADAMKQAAGRGAPRAKRPTHQHEVGAAAGTELSVREFGVLRLICEGLRDKEISARLGIALPTVKVHNRKIFKKLGVDSRVNAVLFAHKQGVV